MEVVDGTLLHDGLVNPAPVIHVNNQPVSSMDAPVFNDSPESNLRPIDPAKTARKKDSVERLLSISQVSEISLTWENINVWASSKGGRSRLAKGGKANEKELDPEKQTGKTSEKHILRNVSGYAKAGTLLAIMGASGAGKSTLMNILTHRNIGKYKIEGAVKVNGQSVGAGIRSISTYVQQDDLFIGTLKVKEHLRFQALLRMDKCFSYSERMEKVNEALSELGLKKCENTLIGIPGRLKGISGGERKRLAFASEMLTNPKLMFCDEPTSGLDSFMAQNIVTSLKALASKGRTILCTIHQPSSEVYAMFDWLLLMAEGRVAYLGSTKNIHAFFERLNYRCPPKFNPADYYVHSLAVIPGKEIQCKAKVEKICDTFENFSQGEVAKHVITDDLTDFSELLAHRSPYKASWIKQLTTLTQRSFLSVLRDPMTIKVRTFQTIVIGIVLGIVYLQQELTQEAIQNITGVLFLFITNMTFQNMFSVVNVFCEESVIFMREHYNGCYRIDAYFLSKMIAELPFFVILPVLFASIDYFMVGLYPSASHFFICAGILVLIANSAASFGYMLSCFSSNSELIMAAASPILMPMMLFGGLYLNVESIPVYFIWLEYLSWFKYGNEALNINQWRDVTEIACPSNMTATCLNNGTDVLQQFSFNADNMYMNIGLLFVLIAGYRFIGFIILLLRTKKSS